MQKWFWWHFFAEKIMTFASSYLFLFRSWSSGIIRVKHRIEWILGEFSMVQSSTILLLIFSVCWRMGVEWGIISESPWLFTSSRGTIPRVLRREENQTNLHKFVQCSSHSIQDATQRIRILDICPFYQESHT